MLCGVLSASALTMIKRPRRHNYGPPPPARPPRARAKPAPWVWGLGFGPRVGGFRGWRV